MGSTQQGKSILITGASKGLGAVLAPRLAEEGASLILMARSAEGLESVKNACTNSNLHQCISVDFLDRVSLQEAIGKCKSKGVDSIVHVAGGGLGLKDPLLSAEDFQKLLNLNFLAGTEINKHLIPQMQQRKQGNVVHVCSIASSEATGSVGYNTAKAALAAYVRTLGRALAPKGIIVTGILPGGFTAPENAFVRFQNRDPDGLQNFIKNRLPRGRLGTAEELLPLLVFLCSDDASMMAGCLVPIDAGEGLRYEI